MILNKISRAVSLGLVESGSLSLGVFGFGWFSWTEDHLSLSALFLAGADASLLSSPLLLSPLLHGRLLSKNYPRVRSGDAKSLAIGRNRLSLPLPPVSFFFFFFLFWRRKHVCGNVNIFQIIDISIRSLSNIQTCLNLISFWYLYPSSIKYHKLYLFFFFKIPFQ